MTTSPVEMAIDPNVRIEGNRTYVGFEDILTGGEIKVGSPVVVRELESNLIGHGTVHEVDFEKQLIFLDVDWRSLNQKDAEWWGGPPIDLLYSRSNVPLIVDWKIRSGSGSAYFPMRGVLWTHVGPAPAVTTKLRKLERLTGNKAVWRLARARKNR